MSIQLAQSESFARLLGSLIQKHVDSYTGSPGFVHITEPDGVEYQPTEDGFVQFHVTMPDGSEYRVEVEAIPDEPDED